MCSHVSGAELVRRSHKTDSALHLWRRVDLDVWVLSRPERAVRNASWAIYVCDCSEHDMYRHSIAFVRGCIRITVLQRKIRVLQSLEIAT